MKKVKFKGKLSLNKETITKLNNEQMANVNGGGTNSQNICTYPRDYTCPGYIGCGGNTLTAFTGICSPNE
ncbi:MAG: class I lanthipeptide [Bacteroidetes bacterium]|nr:class I lanthipeptide [Bacteroidota bacterium]